MGDSRRGERERCGIPQGETREHIIEMRWKRILEVPAGWRDGVLLLLMLLFVAYLAAVSLMLLLVLFFAVFDAGSVAVLIDNVTVC